MIKYENIVKKRYIKHFIAIIYLFLNIKILVLDLRD